MKTRKTLSFMRLISAFLAMVFNRAVFSFSLLIIVCGYKLSDAAPRRCAQFLSYGVFLDLSGPQGFARTSKVAPAFLLSESSVAQKMPSEVVAAVNALDAEAKMTLVVEVAGITRPEFFTLLEEFQSHGVVLSNPQYMSIAAATFLMTGNRKKIISVASHSVVSALHIPLDESAPSDSSLYSTQPQGFASSSQVYPIIQPPLRTVEQKLSVELLPQVRALIAERKLVVDAKVQGLGRSQFETLIQEFQQNGVTILEPIYNGYDNTHIKIQATRHTLIHALSHPAITLANIAF